jgi:hypothetical protein
MLMAALAVPSAVAAPISSFKGSVTGDENSKVTFKVLKNKKGKRRVDYPKAKLLDAQCEAGPQEIDVVFGSPEKAAKISHTGEFSFDNSGTDEEGHEYVAIVHGVISGGSASGELRYQGLTVSETAEQNCDTGEVKWTAKKAGTRQTPSRAAQSGGSFPSASSAARR